VKKLDIKIDDLASPEFKSVLNRAESRIEEAILFRAVSQKSPNDDIEILSFPIAVMMVAATADSLIKSRYALAEAKRVSGLLTDEKKEKAMEIANTFNWKLRIVDGNINAPPYDFALRFPDFLKNATGFQDKKWKLVNRLLSNGEVYLTKHDVSRLLEEEVRRYIEEKLDTKVESLPSNIMDHINRFKQMAIEKRGEIQLEEIPKSVVIAAFPPCIKGVYDTIASGRSTSHIGRFALTSFLINIGMPVEDLVNFFRSVSDFDERMTRYQVEHIAGVRGSRTKYIPPRCDTLRTHGICTSTDEICKKVRHPLAYYRRKLKTIKTEVAVERV
jgi:DNA primase large subunit